MTNETQTEHEEQENTAATKPAVHTTATAAGETSITISQPVAAGAEDVHPVKKAVAEHLAGKIVEALESVPATIEHDFAATVNWIKGLL